MTDPSAGTNPESRLDATFQAYERNIRVANYRTCGVLAILFMFAGSGLDWIVYGPEGMRQFFHLRLGSAAVLAVIQGLLLTKWGARWHRQLGLMMAMPLIAAIAWMIAITEGAESPYYAGLNLVLLGAAVLMRWPLADSIAVVALTLAAYLAACYFHGPITNARIFLNNLYFLFVTGVFATAGTWVYNRIRFSEFSSRYNLDINRRELEAANVKLEENNRQLLALDEAKGRFFANISHELRTPLTLLIAPLDALINKCPPDAPDRDTLGTMHANAMRLLKLINDLLDLVRLESGRVQVNATPLDIAKFVQGQAAAVRNMAESRKVAVTSAVDPNLVWAMVDEEKLERVCLNLLFNAIKFTPAGGTVSVTATKKREWLELQVADTGVGIAQEQLAHVFDRFWQADTSSNRKQRGLGIGLALVKEIVEAQGGSVSATSEVGTGTTMTVPLPLHTAEPGASAVRAQVMSEPQPAGHQQWLADLYRRADMFPATQAAAPAGLAMEPAPRSAQLPLLLIAEDEPDMIRFLKGELSEVFQVIEAIDGAKAVEMAIEHLPDVVLCDVMMPAKDGLQVCSELRANEHTQGIPIVMLTAKGDEKTKLDLLKAGASDFLAKPFSLTEVSVRLINLANTRLHAKLMARQKEELAQSLAQLKETEALLVRNEKLASLGRLSAGLIHEINNPLHYAKQALYVLRRITKNMPEADRPPLMEIVDDVEGGIDRVAAIISDLRGFASRSGEESTHFKLRPAIETTLRFFSATWNEGVGIEVDVPEDLELVGDRNHFLQVLINLLQNALDAVALKDYGPDEKPMVVIRASSQHDIATIRIRDNGPGISAENMNRIFDPFFTTKDVGEGMGLGLAITHRIISEHRGTITVISEPGSHTEFTLQIPLTHAPAVTTPAPTP